MYDPTTARALRRWCKRRKLTPADLAVATGKSFSTIRRWMVGDSVPTIAEVRKLEALAKGCVREIFRVGGRR